ncbi:DNA topoisomerase [Phytophthora palmivora]|nr:DNA topoisomerase [Phytophthora palmivora]
MQTLISKGKSSSIKLKKEKPASDNKDEDALAKKAQAHLFQRTPSADQVAKKIENWKKKIKALSLRLQDKTDNKEVALGTSKLNYMDPRITVAWCKRNEVPISAVFSKTLREKFVWAMDVDPHWKF